MRKQLFLLSFLVLFSAIVFAQENKPPVRERLESLKVGFLTERLNLSAEEAKSILARL
ncbi:MAG: hypothetical protein IPO49_09770 [Bacteroidetes bacterium]|nr:hypothetical protein [Bacteroidota bacterium]